MPSQTKKSTGTVQRPKPASKNAKQKAAAVTGALKEAASESLSQNKANSTLDTCEELATHELLALDMAKLFSPKHRKENTQKWRFFRQIDQNTTTLIFNVEIARKAKQIAYC